MSLEFAWTVNSDQNISFEVIENLARTMWLRMMRLYSVYAVSTMQHNKRSAEAVVRDSSERRLLAVYIPTGGINLQLGFRIFSKARVH
jgi:hypothetical protein